MRTLLRVLVIGFAVVIALLAAAGVIGVHNARSITASTEALVADQLVITRLLDEVEREQVALNAAYYRLSRAPEKVERANYWPSKKPPDSPRATSSLATKKSPRSSRIWPI